MVKETEITSDEFIWPEVKEFLDRSRSKSIDLLEHHTDGSDCWCDPEIEDIGNGIKIITHRQRH